MRTHIGRRRLIQQRRIQRPVAVQGIAVIDRVALRTVPYTVDIPLAAGIIPRMEIRRHRLHSVHGDTGGR